MGPKDRARIKRTVEAVFTIYCWSILTEIDVVKSSAVEIWPQGAAILRGAGFAIPDLKCNGFFTQERVFPYSPLSLTALNRVFYCTEYSFSNI